MQWDDTDQAGFTTGTPWLAVNPNYTEINAAAEVADPDSVFNYYRRVIQLRHELPVVAHGDFTMLLPDDERIYAFTRGLGTVALLVLANFSDITVTADLPEAESWSASEHLLSNYPDYPSFGSPSVTLRPWEARVEMRTDRS